MDRHPDNMDRHPNNMDRHPNNMDNVDTCQCQTETKAKTVRHRVILPVI